MRDLGDFQTPPALVSEILQFLMREGLIGERVLEPTCGRGHFLAGLAALPTPPREVIGIELQSPYVAVSREVLRDGSLHGCVGHADLFALNLSRDLQWRTSGRLLVIGNPPWVTNSELGALQSVNLPRKSNLKALSGLDALTGAANFDLAEFIILKILCELRDEQPTLALLCKTATARAVLEHAERASLPITRAALYRVDAPRWFGAAVDACLFVLQTGNAGKRSSSLITPVYADLSATMPEALLSCFNGRLVAESGECEDWRDFDGQCPFNWRQGIKHDAAGLLELRRDGDAWLNGKGEAVCVEDEYLYPLLKSTDLFHGRQGESARALALPQTRVGADTHHLARTAPQLWHYLDTHRAAFDARRSSIYQGKSPFSVFGVGDYSFAPYKVAVSGLHKQPRFRAIGPLDGKPVLFDDTCYLLPFATSDEAALCAALLNSSPCLDFLKVVAFTDAKRPFTKKVLQRIALRVLAQRGERETLLCSAVQEAHRAGFTLSENAPHVLDELACEGQGVLL